MVSAFSDQQYAPSEFKSRGGLKLTGRRVETGAEESASLEEAVTVLLPDASRIASDETTGFAEDDDDDERDDDEDDEEDLSLEEGEDEEEEDDNEAPAALAFSASFIAISLAFWRSSSLSLSGLLLLLVLLEPGFAPDDDEDGTDEGDDREEEEGAVGAGEVTGATGASGVGVPSSSSLRTRSE